jgi:hypothetical protein
VVNRRIGAWWIAAVVLPLVVSGLVLMHVVDLSPAAATSPGEHAAVAGDAEVAAAEIHGEDHHHGCDDCHGMHLTAAMCVAVLGSIAVWRLVRHFTHDAPDLHSADSSVGGRWTPARLLPRRERPPWVAWGVMLC